MTHILSQPETFRQQTISKQKTLLANFIQRAEKKRMAVNTQFLQAIRFSKTLLSGRLDSNQRPLAPHANALPGCATSRTFLDTKGCKCTQNFCSQKSATSLIFAQFFLR